MPNVNSQLQVLDVLIAKLGVTLPISFVIDGELCCMLSAQEVGENDVIDAVFVVCERIVCAVRHHHHDYIRILRTHDTMD